MNKFEKYIEEQKSTLPNEYLEGRIIASIESLGAENLGNKGLSLWQTVSLAAGFVLMVALGINLGNSVKTSDFNSSLVINDNYIEQLSLYNNDAEE